MGLRLHLLVQPDNIKSVCIWSKLDSVGMMLAAVMRTANCLIYYSFISQSRSISPSWLYFNSLVLIHYAFFSSSFTQECCGHFDVWLQSQPIRLLSISVQHVFTVQQLDQSVALTVWGNPTRLFLLPHLLNQFLIQHNLWWGGRLGKLKM